MQKKCLSIFKASIFMLFPITGLYVCLFFSSRLLVLSPGGKGVFGRRVRLGLSNEDVLFALKQAEKESDKD
jgi:hypothetical protein